MGPGGGKIAKMTDSSPGVARTAICLVGDIDPPPGGVATYCRHLASGLAARGWDVTVLDTSGHPGKRAPVGVRRYVATTAVRSLPYALLPGGVQVGRRIADMASPLSIRDRLRATSLGARLLNLLDPATAGLVHSNHAGVRSLAAAAAAELMGLPLAVTIHGSEFTSPALAHHLPVARAVCQRAAVVYSNSAFTAAAAMAHGVDRPIEVVHLGVDPERFHPGPVPAGFLARYDLAAEARRILFAGWLSHNKGPDVLLSAFERLEPASREGIECVFVGPDRGYLGALRDQVRRSGLPGVRVLPRIAQSDLPDFYRAAEILVVPTRSYEGFGLVALEGMASGCAVVASNLGGIPEALGGAGLLFDPGDVAGLAGLLGELLADPVRLTDLRAAGPVTADRFGWDLTVARTEASYWRVLRPT